MTFVQRSESAHRSTSSAREPQSGQQHNAIESTATMSDHGPEQRTSITTTFNNHPSVGSPVLDTRRCNVSTQTLKPHEEDSDIRPLFPGHPQNSNIVKPIHRKPEASPLIRFSDLAENLRLQRHLEHRQRSLKGRTRTIQKHIALSARLHRIGSWVRDGLVEISKHSDAAGFVRVHQHMQDLVDLAYSQWNHELCTIEAPETADSTWTSALNAKAFLPKLTSNAQNDLILLVSWLRSNPKFLLERFRTLPHSQIVALSTFPRFSDISESVLSSFHTRTRVSQQRNKRVLTFSKALEDYASSFERSNPLSLLLFNVYGTDSLLTGSENRLRLYTWSIVCAELLATYDEAYQALLPQLLSSFAALHEWKVKDGVELFLMDVLQRGSFLLDLVAKSNGSHNGYDPLNTQEAHEFFEQASIDLFAILTRSDGGFPVGALQLASAVLSKLRSEEQQMQFRGEFFSRWFLELYLRIVITYPENENMLLKFHISKDARDYILFPLWTRIDAMVTDTFSANPAQEVPDQFRYYVEQMVATLEDVAVDDPYSPQSQDLETDITSTITICPSEIVQVLEALSPQAIHGVGQFDSFMTSSTSAFHALYPRTSDRFDRLRRELLLILEPGLSVSDVHPCQEQWLHLGINFSGQPFQFEPVPKVPDTQRDFPTSLDHAQRAVLRMCHENDADLSSSSTSYRSDFCFSWPLETAFQDMVKSAAARSDPMARMYWEDALETLYNKYPKSHLLQNDSAVLRELVEASKQAQLYWSSDCTKLEAELRKLEDLSARIRATVTQFVGRFEDLRLKMWYSLDVISSKFYEDAKNITHALNNMAISIVRSGTTSSSIRLSISSRSTTSSLIEQTLEDTISMLKAPIEWGGPKKLADIQIDNTKKWLQRSNVDNFCTGEERIHRFCMEVATLSKKLVGESLAESPVLWSSKLFAREQNYYDVHTFGIASAPASTRPASVMSDTFSNLRNSRPPYRSNDSARMAFADDRRSPTRKIPGFGTANGRNNHDNYTSDLASSIGSPGIAFSSGTAESISTFWSPLPSNSRSLTSASVYSRAPSTFNDTTLSRFTDTAREKTKFLEQMQRTLICLILSDLGCPVWSLGSETDAWLESSRNANKVDQRLKQRIVVQKLISQRNSQVPDTQRSTSVGLRRRTSLPGISRTRDYSTVTEDTYGAQTTTSEAVTFEPTHTRDLEGLEELLAKISQHVDPIEKLRVVEEFYNLSVIQMQSEVSSSPYEDSEYAKTGGSYVFHRRNSLTSQDELLSQQSRRRLQVESQSRPIRFGEQEIVRQLKIHLTKLRPRTLFRDLQYIAAFVPSDLTDKTPLGEAFLRLGLAALDYKDEVCRAMVDIADGTMVKDAKESVDSASSIEPGFVKATEYWMLAAKEGNAIAQREVALLYLSHPQSLPIMTRPLALASEIFRDDMLWQESNEANSNTQALCLALHWMQQAADGEDELARQKLDERKAVLSI